MNYIEYAEVIMIVNTITWTNYYKQYSNVIARNGSLPPLAQLIPMLDAIGFH